MKLIKIISISLCIIILFSGNVFALGNIINMGESWENIGIQHTNTTMDTSNLSNISSQLYNILLSVATIVAIIVGAILGLQYMTAGIDKKVEVKESLFPYIVSCIVVFGSLGIWKLTVTIMREINPSPNTTITTTQSGSGSTTHESSSGQTHGGGSTTHESSSGQIYGGAGGKF